MEEVQVHTYNHANTHTLILTPFDFYFLHTAASLCLVTLSESPHPAIEAPLFRST